MVSLRQKQHSIENFAVAFLKMLTLYMLWRCDRLISYHKKSFLVIGNKSSIVIRWQLEFIKKYFLSNDYLWQERMYCAIKSFLVKRNDFLWQEMFFVAINDFIWLKIIFFCWKWFLQQQMVHFWLMHVENGLLWSSHLIEFSFNW